MKFSTAGIEKRTWLFGDYRYAHLLYVYGHYLHLTKLYHRFCLLIEIKALVFLIVR